jgi:hypothetical protein
MSRRAIKEDHFSNINNIRNLTLFEYQYRTAPTRRGGRRQRAWSSCMSSDGDPVTTGAALEVLLGVRVEMRSTEAQLVPLRQSTKQEAQSSTV